MRKSNIQSTEAIEIMSMAEILKQQRLENPPADSMRALVHPGDKEQLAWIKEQYNHLLEVTWRMEELALAFQPINIKMYMNMKKEMFRLDAVRTGIVNSRHIPLLQAAIPMAVTNYHKNLKQNKIWSKV